MEVLAGSGCVAWREEGGREGDREGRRDGGRDGGREEGRNADFIYTEILARPGSGFYLHKE